MSSRDKVRKLLQPQHNSAYPVCNKQHFWNIREVPAEWWTCAHSERIHKEHGAHCNILREKTSIWALREVGISPKPRDWSQWCQVLGNGGPFEVVNFQLKALVVALLGLEVRSCSYSWFTWEVLGRQLREVCCLNRLCKHVPQPCYLWLKGKLTQLFTWVAGFGCQVTLIISAIQFCVVDEPASTCNL